MYRHLIILAMVCAAAVGCRHPVQVATTSKVQTGVIPVDLNSGTIPVRVEIAGQPMVVETGTFPIKDAAPLEEMIVEPGANGAGAKVALIDIDGLLLNKNPIGFSSVGENPVSIFREKLDRVQKDPTYRAVILRINTPGGGVTACDIMRQDLIDFKNATNLPVIACLMDVGAGGGYYIATAADHIIAHPTSVVGGIGVILNIYDLEDALGVLNIVGTPIKAGEHTDLGTPVRRMPEESRELLQQIADEFHGRFQDAVIASRPGMDPANGDLFDGRVVTATTALTAGLVDRIGYLDEAIRLACASAQTPHAAVVVLHRPKDPARTPYDITPNIPAQRQLLPSISGLDRSHLPTFMYIWQPDPSIEVSLGR